VKTFLLSILIFPALLFGQADETSRSWNQPREPFRIIGNIYYVGASDIAAYLITTPAGHFLLDGGFVETAPMILSNIRELGFDPTDVKILLNSQAHFDHAGGLSELKHQTGARMLASQEDGLLLNSGGKGDFYFGDKMLFPPVQVDETIRDRHAVRLGEINMTPVLTPGHTRGCTTWTTKAQENGHIYDVVFLCGLTILPETQFVGNKKYPNIAADFRKSYEILKNLTCDVLLGAHGSYFHLEEKVVERNAKKDNNPFINPAELRDYVEEKEREFAESTTKTQSH
jgi:metallo-beta-lactamase class B